PDAGRAACEHGADGPGGSLGSPRPPARVAGADGLTRGGERVHLGLARRDADRQGHQLRAVRRPCGDPVAVLRPAGQEGARVLAPALQPASQPVDRMADMAGLTGPMLPHWKPLQYDVPAETAWPRWARLLSRALTLTVVIAVGLW